LLNIRATGISFIMTHPAPVVLTKNAV